MIQIGNKSLHWTNMKNQRIFITNFFISLTIVSFIITKSFNPIWIVILILSYIIFQISPKLIQYPQKLAHFIGQLNSFLILVVAYFFVFVPFGIIYHLFYKNQSFKIASSRWIDSKKTVDFNKPY